MKWVLIIMMLTNRGAMSEQVPGFADENLCLMAGLELRGKYEERTTQKVSIDFICLEQP